MMIEEDEKLAGDQSRHINLKVKGNDEKEMLFRIKRSTRLNKLMNAYCNRQSFGINSVKFLFNGYPIRADQTPLELDMEDGAEIDAIIDGSHELIYKAVPRFQSGSHNDSSPYVGLQSGPGIRNVVGNSTNFVTVCLPNSGVNDKQAGCCVTHLVKEDGTFNRVGLDNFIKKVKLGERGTSYAVIAIMGPQCSGKSTLLNHLFHTNFKEMDACNGRSPTTRGLWIAKGTDTEPCTIVMDLQGTDERGQGEDDTTFEKQSARFVLAISDIVIINMWCRDVVLEQAASKRLLKTVFQVMWQSSIPRKTCLMFVIRDQTSTPLENLEPVLREDIQKIWDSIPKPEAHKHTSLSENFNVQVVALSSYEDGAEQFKKQVASLREKLFQSITTPGGLAGGRRGAVPASGFSFSAQQIWKDIRENKDIDLPAHKVLVANALREEFANGKYSSSVANKRMGRKRKADAPVPSDEQLDLPQHPDLHFPQTTVAYKRIRLHAPRQILRPLTIDWDMLTRFGETRRVEAIFGGDTPWRRFFDVGYHPAYRVLTLEFLCTFFFTPPAPNVLATEKCITFTIHGKQYECTLGEFGVLLGFYTAEEVASPLFLDAPHETDQDILQRWWPRLTGGIPWGSGRDRTTRATSIVDPLHRYLHRCISSTITGRDHSREQVSQVDLFYLRSLLGPSRANLAWGMAAHFTSLHKAKASSKILCGAYITQIAESLGVLTQEHTEMVLGMYGCERLDRSSVVSMGLAYKIDSLGEREYRWSFDKGKTVWDAYLEGARAHVGADPLPIPKAEGNEEVGVGDGVQDGGSEGGGGKAGCGGGSSQEGGGGGGGGSGGVEDVSDQQRQRSHDVGVVARMWPDDVQRTLGILDGRVRRTEELAERSLQTGHLGLETGQRAEDMARRSLVLVERSYEILHWLMTFARESANRGGFLLDLPPIPVIPDDDEPRPSSPPPPA